MTWIDKATFKQTLRLAWPISVQSILTNLLSMIDIAMVSHLGNTAVSAVGLSNRFQFTLMVVVLGIAWTVGILSAQRFGAGQIEKMRAAIGMGSILATVALLPLIVLVVLYGEYVIRIASDNAEIVELGAHYLAIVTPSLCFAAVILCIENGVRAMGHVKLPLLLSAVAMLINIILNFWLINGGLGIPALGVTGAAIATVCARFFQLILLVAVLRYQKHTLHIRRSDIAHFFDRTEAIRFIRMATPMMVSFGVWSSGTFVYQVIYGRMGTTELAVMSMLTPIESVFIALFFGLASASSITIGQHLGADRFAQAWICAKSFSILNPSVALVAGAILLACQPLVFLPFSRVPDATYDLAFSVFVVISLSAWIKVINMTLAMGVLRAGGDNKVCMYIDMLGMWVISIPLTALVAFYFQAPLILVVLTSYSEELCKALLFIPRTLQKRWLRNLTNNSTQQHKKC